MIKNNLRHVRERSEIDQTELGRRANVQQTHISEFERTGDGLSLPALKRIASALGCHIHINFVPVEADEDRLIMATILQDVADMLRSEVL